ncbi:MAG TPA: 23S rRNA (adenine(2503)-C(2))-methyltransferase RlmN [Luteolibacter sp.]|nr:23S rRNA (adenine(2503)-C(2))-methyltransferase RlmN [Luteolibacter sp.]
MNGGPQSLHDLGFAEIDGLLRTEGINPVHTKALWRALHRDAEADLSTRTDFLPPLLRWVQENVGEGKRFFLDVPEVADETHSSDGLTKKFLLKLRDGQTIETVLMGYDGRQTACVSTQAGCAMGCVFCATGQMGFVRHLRPGEIIAQVNHVRRVLKQYAPDKRLRNLVMMGMGEPLHNYDSVMHALGTISDSRGASIGPSKISVSTVGLVPAILRLADEAQPYNLAVSLHGSTEEERSALIPVSKKYNLESLVDACRKYGAITGRRIFFGWTLIQGKNDSEETARRLAELLKGIDAHINLIPLNPTSGFDGKTSANTAGVKFQRILRDAGFPCTFRQRRGIDVAAGCGQLKADKKSRAAS